MITAVVITLVLLLTVALVIAIAMEPGPSPADVAVAYEHAVDRHDARTLWGLVAPELRGGRTRGQYVTEEHRQLAERPRDRVATVEITDEFSGRDEASVLTVVHLTDGSSTTKRTRCERHHGAWRIRSVSELPESELPGDGATPP